MRERQQPVGHRSTSNTTLEVDLAVHEDEIDLGLDDDFVHGRVLGIELDDERVLDVVVAT